MIHFFLPFSRTWGNFSWSNDFLTSLRRKTPPAALLQVSLLPSAHCQTHPGACCLCPRDSVALFPVAVKLPGEALVLLWCRNLLARAERCLMKHNRKVFTPSLLPRYTEVTYKFTCHEFHPRAGFGFICQVSHFLQAMPASRGGWQLPVVSGLLQAFGE